MQVRHILRLPVFVAVRGRKEIQVSLEFDPAAVIRHKESIPLPEEEPNIPECHRQRVIMIYYLAYGRSSFRITGGLFYQMFKKVLVCAMSAILLAGCGSAAPAQEPAEPASSSADVTSFKTIGDIYAANPNVRESGNTNDTYFCVFELNGNLYRAYADISSDVFDQLMALDFSDSDYDAKQQAILAPLPIRQFDDLTAMIPSQEELDQWIGKTGKDLLDDGWTEGFGYNLEDMDFYLNKGPFSYVVRFEKDKEYQNSDDFDVEAVISPLTIVSVTYDGIGNGAEIF